MSWLSPSGALFRGDHQAVLGRSANNCRGLVQLAEPGLEMCALRRRAFVLPGQTSFVLPGQNNGSPGG